MYIVKKGYPLDCFLSIFLGWSDVIISQYTITWTSEDSNDGATYTVRLTPKGIEFKNRPSDYNIYSAKFVFIED